MNTQTHSIQMLAGHLLALEAARGSALGGPTERVCDQLRATLGRLAGLAGFRTLLARALALAQAEVESLKSVRVGADGSLVGFDEGTSGLGPGGAGGVAIVSHLLGLLATFV